jgi:hypothetical protein
MESKDSDKRRRYTNPRDWTVEEDTILRSLMYEGMGGQNSTYLTSDQVAAGMTHEASNRKISNCNRTYSRINIRNRWQQLKGPNSYPPAWQQPGFKAANAKGLDTRRAAAASEAAVAPEDGIVEGYLESGRPAATEADAAINDVQVAGQREDSVRDGDKKEYYAFNDGTLEILWKKAAP